MSNVRLASWIHVAFLLAIVLCWSRPPFCDIANTLSLTVFLPHTLTAYWLGGFSSDYPFGVTMIVLTVLSAVAAFPFSLLYAWLIHRGFALLQRLQGRRSSSSHANV